MQWLFSFAWSESQLKKNKKKLGIVRTPLRLGGVGILGFWVMGHCQNIFGFRRSFYEEVVYFVGGGRFILLLFSHFEILDLKKSKKKKLWLPHPHFQDSHFQIQDRCRAWSRYWLNTEFKFSFSRSSFFSPLSGRSKPTKPWNWFLFYPFGRFRGPSKPSSQ